MRPCVATIPAAKLNESLAEASTTGCSTQQSETVTVSDCFFLVFFLAASAVLSVALSTIAVANNAIFFMIL